MSPAIHYPPGHPMGFDEDYEVLERAATLLVQKYALPQNIRNGNLGFLLAPSEKKPAKRWYSNLKTLNHHMIAEQMRAGKRCYGVAHSSFSNLFVLDIDHPEKGDCDVLESGLRGHGWKYKKFHSGRGRHLWVFFSDLPNELLREYCGGPGVMKEIARTFVSLYQKLLQGTVDIRGCTSQLMKMPLQFDPYYQRIIMPYGEDDELICDYRRAVDYAGNIERNESGKLVDWLRIYQPDQSGKLFSTEYPGQDHRGSSCTHCADEDIQSWLEEVRVGPGESNDFIFHFVLRCYRASMTSKDTIHTAKKLYREGRSQGRVTCKDTWTEWKSKVKGRIKKLWSLAGNKGNVTKVKFYKNDLKWIEKHAVKPGDALFLSIHLWARRLAGSDEYYLSRRKAEEWGMPSKMYRITTDRFIRCGVIKIIAPGKQAPPSLFSKGKATIYRLLRYPEPSGVVLGAANPTDLFGECKALKNTNNVGPSSASI